MRLRTLVLALCLCLPASAQTAGPNAQLQQLTKQAKALATVGKTEDAILLLQRNLASRAAKGPGAGALADALETLGDLASKRAGEQAQASATEAEVAHLYDVAGALYSRALELRERSGLRAGVGRLYFKMQQAEAAIHGLAPAPLPPSSEEEGGQAGLGSLGQGEKKPAAAPKVELAADATGGITYCVLRCDPLLTGAEATMDPADIASYQAEVARLEREGRMFGAADHDSLQRAMKQRKQREAEAAAYARQSGEKPFPPTHSNSVTVGSVWGDVQASSAGERRWQEQHPTTVMIAGFGKPGSASPPEGTPRVSTASAREEEARRQAELARRRAEEQLRAEREREAQARASEEGARMEERAEPGTGGGPGDTYSKHQTVEFPDEKVEGELKKPVVEEKIAKPNVEYIYPRERFPQIDAPDDVATATEFVVQVSLTEQQTDTATQIVAGEKTAEGRLRMNAPAGGGKDWTFDVVLSAPGFSFTRGSNTGKIVLPPQGDSTPAQFWLRARGPLAKPAVLTATLWQDGGYIAKVMRVIVVRAEQGATRQPANEASAAAVAAPAASAERSEPAAKQAAAASQRSAAAKPAQPAAPREPVDVRRNMDVPDLTLFLLHDESGNATLVVNSPYLQPSQHTLRPNPGLDTWLKAQYSALVRRTVIKDPEAPVFLRGFGRELYQQFAPAPFKEAFWKLADKLGPRFHSIQIFTDDPTLPWELMRPSRADGTGERDFLGLDFAIARWHVTRDAAQLDRPEQFEEVERVVVLAPHYEGDVALPAQSSEVVALSHLGGYAAPPARLETLRALLRELPQGIIHFAGHGQAQRRDGSVQYAIQLEDGALDLMTWRGLVEAGQRNHPIFFMNACEIGSANAVANFVDGWAPEVLRTGASGYIGALWAVDDDAASEFARRFYDGYEKELQTQAEVDVGELLARTRREVYAKTGSPTALAYVFYGDANLKLVGK